MARFLVLWHVNPLAPWPTDPLKYLELEEKTWAIIDEHMKKGEIEEFATFPEGHRGYVIGKGETADVYATACMFSPYVIVDAVHEIIPYEKHKEILRAVLKAHAVATGK